jgi:hypothetical protein
MYTNIGKNVYRESGCLMNFKEYRVSGNTVSSYPQFKLAGFHGQIHVQVPESQFTDGKCPVHRPAFTGVEGNALKIL